MLTFEQSLVEESQWLARVIGQPMPSDPRAGHRVYIGPTRIDFTMLPERAAAPGQTPARIPPNEAESLKRWRAQSLDYLHGHYRPPYVDPMHPNRSF